MQILANTHTHTHILKCELAICVMFLVYFTLYSHLIIVMNIFVILLLLLQLL